MRQLFCLDIDLKQGNAVALAIFDLDNTLLAGDSDHAWGEFLVQQGLVDEQVFKDKNDYYYEQYQAGQLDIHEYLAFALEPLTKYPEDQLLALREQFLQTVIEPMITKKGLGLLADHKAKGDYLLIITATNGFVTQPIAERLGVDDIIATDPEVVDGQYTGKVAGTPSFQHGKVTRLDDWLRQNQLSLSGSYFYSDSHNDLPLLEKVDYPVAVDADPQLIEAANRNNWSIISLRG